MFKVSYIGAAKERDDGSQTATGFIEDGWNLILPLNVLHSWFGEEKSKPGEASTLYAVLGIAQKATKKEIWKAHRLAARTWHPDVNKDPDAPKLRRRIQEAYKALSDPPRRKKYDAGLKYERDFEQRNENRTGYIAKLNIWKPPLRCGWLTVEGTMNVGRFTVRKILSWQEITNEDGQSMVSYWPVGEKEFATEWV